MSRRVEEDTDAQDVNSTCDRSCCCCCLGPELSSTSPARDKSSDWKMIDAKTRMAVGHDRTCKTLTKIPLLSATFFKIPGITVANMPTVIQYRPFQANFHNFLSL